VRFSMSLPPWIIAHAHGWRTDRARDGSESFGMVGNRSV
jgi:hypothetical protein